MDQISCFKSICEVPHNDPYVSLPPSLCLTVNYLRRWKPFHFQAVYFNQRNYLPFLCDLTFESHIRVPVLIDASVSMLILQLDELEKHESGDGTAIEEETKIVAKDGT